MVLLIWDSLLMHMHVRLFSSSLIAWRNLRRGGGDDCFCTNVQVGRLLLEMEDAWMLGTSGPAPMVS
jgi:hypothetical protein